MIIGIDASRANVAERTGTERYAFEVITRLLPKLQHHRVRLYVREELRPEWGIMPAHVEVCILRWPPAVMWSHLRLSWEMLWRRPDVLFVPADTVPIIHAPRTITTIHDIAFERYPELYRGASVQRRLGLFRPLIHGVVRLFTLGRYSASERDYHRWSVRQAVRVCPTILTVSEFTKHEIVSLLHVAPERIIVTPLGVRPPEYFSRISQDDVAQRKKSLELVEPYFLFIGRLESKKNIGLLLRSYVTYRSVVDRPHDLVLIGQAGFGWPEALDSVGGTLPPGVHQLGWQFDASTDEILVGASALIMISEYEGFGIPAVEALSAGLPVIASRHGSLPEVLSTYATFIDTTTPGTIVEAMKNITAPAAAFNYHTLPAKEYARRFSWDRTAEKTYAVLGQ